MKYCSECGKPKLAKEVPINDTFERIICSHCQTIHYINPKVIVGCLPIWQNSILLCKRNIPPRKGYWNLPCGFLENLETVEEGAERELREEANTEVHLKHIHTVFSLPHISQVYIIFLGYLKQKSFSCGFESKEVALFSEENIPWGNIAFESTTHALKEYYRNRQNVVTKIGELPLIKAQLLD